MEEEYQLWLVLKEKYGDFETEEEFWTNLKSRNKENECPF